MGFICPECGKSFGTNKEWFDDHLIAHRYKERPIERIIIIKEERKATLGSIANSIKADRIRIFQNGNGGIVFLDVKGKREIEFDPYYDMNREAVPKEERDYRHCYIRKASMDL